MKTIINTPHEALVCSLVIAICAENDGVSRRALRLAEDFAARMSDRHVGAAKREAELLASMWPHDTNAGAN